MKLQLLLGHLWVSISESCLNVVSNMLATHNALMCMHTSPLHTAPSHLGALHQAHTHTHTRCTFMYADTCTLIHTATHILAHTQPHIVPQWVCLFFAMCCKRVSETAAVGVVPVAAVVYRSSRGLQRTPGAHSPASYTLTSCVLPSLSLLS